MESKRDERFDLNPEDDHNYVEMRRLIKELNNSVQEYIKQFEKEPEAISKLLKEIKTLGDDMLKDLGDRFKMLDRSRSLLERAHARPDLMVLKREVFNKVRENKTDRDQKYYETLYTLIVGIEKCNKAFEEIKQDELKRSESKSRVIQQIDASAEKEGRGKLSARYLSPRSSTSTPRSLSPPRDNPEKPSSSPRESSESSSEETPKPKTPGK